MNFYKGNKFFINQQITILGNYRIGNNTQFTRKQEKHFLHIISQSLELGSIDNIPQEICLESVERTNSRKATQLSIVITATEQLVHSHIIIHESHYFTVPFSLHLFPTLHRGPFSYLAFLLFKINKFEILSHFSLRLVFGSSNESGS